ncbi:M20 family peptidase [Alteromonadaceae bacterium M269]|nr:M20 family peptidase [Alteromonadaceae bacterium M269]
MKRYLLGILIFSFSIVSHAELTSDEKRVVNAVENRFSEQVTFLERVVNLNSGTLNVKGVKEVGAVFQKEFDRLGFETQWIDMPSSMKRAGHLIATKRFGPGPHVLLIGHIDTVFEPDSPFQSFSVDGNTAKGPGISDMKGGDVTALYALQALIESTSLNKGTVTVFFTGDEESVGKPLELARKDLIEAGKRADVALNFEGGSEGWAVIGRRGSSSWSLEVTAKQAHSSGIFRDSVGAGAVFEMSRVLNRIYGEVRGEFGLTFNPGIIAGGTSIEQGNAKTTQTVSGKTNVVAQKAIMHGGLRFMNEDQKERARLAMRKIAEDSLPHSQSVMTFEDRYPAMEETEANKALLAKLNVLHADLGVEEAKSFPPERRGAADISFIAPYVTSMDGLGVSGSGAHAPGETMEIDSMLFATQRAAVFIKRLLEQN